MTQAILSRCAGLALAISALGSAPAAYAQSGVSTPATTPGWGEFVDQLRDLPARILAAIRLRINSGRARNTFWIHGVWTLARNAR